VKKSEKAAKERLRQVNGRNGDLDTVTVVTRRGAHMEGNQGQAVSQGFGSGIRDMLSGRKKGKS
jgi:hypothetical protein